MIKWNGKDVQLITVNELINKIHKEKKKKQKLYKISFSMLLFTVHISVSLYES